MEIPSRKSNKVPVPSSAMRRGSGDVALRRLARGTWTVACIWELASIDAAHICGMAKRILVVVALAEVAFWDVRKPNSLCCG
jgi:hypothetical protein